MFCEQCYKQSSFHLDGGIGPQDERIYGPVIYTPQTFQHHGGYKDDAQTGNLLPLKSDGWYGLGGD